MFASFKVKLYETIGIYEFKDKEEVGEENEKEEKESKEQDHEEDGD